MKKFMQLSSLCAIMLGLVVSCERGGGVDTTPALGAPTELKFEVRSTTTAKLSWTAVEGAEAYNVQVGERALLKVTGTEYKVTELTRETTYSWKVQAIKGGIESAWAVGEEFTTPAEDPETAKPADLKTVDVTKNSAKFTWKHDDADVHQISINNQTPKEVTEPAFEVTGLTPDTEYTWKVRSGKNDAWSEWVEGAAFTTLSAPLTGLAVINVTHNGAVIGWDSYNGNGIAYHITVNGAFDEAALAAAGLAALYNPATKEFSGYVNNIAANAIGLKPFLLPETAYTWKVAVVRNEKGEENPAVEGPGFTTLQVDPVFISRFGNYSAVGTPGGVEGAAGKPEWSGAVTSSIVPNKYAVSNFFNTDVDNGVDWGFFYIDYVKEGNKLYLDNKNAVAGTTDGSTKIFSAGVILKDGKPSSFAPEGSVEIAWDDTARTFTFPTRIGGEEVAYAFVVFKNGQPNSFASDLYKNVVVTVSASNGAAAFSATRVGSRTMPNGALKNYSRIAPYSCVDFSEIAK